MPQASDQGRFPTLDIYNYTYTFTKNWFYREFESIKYPVMVRRIFLEFSLFISENIQFDRNSGTFSQCGNLQVLGINKFLISRL